MQESIVFLVCVQCRCKDSSRSLSHLLMSFLFLHNKCDVNKLDTLPYRMLQNRFDILNRLGVAYECDGQTDGHMDRQTDRTAVSSSDVNHRLSVASILLRGALFSHRPQYTGYPAKLLLTPSPRRIKILLRNVTSHSPMRGCTYLF